MLETATGSGWAIPAGDVQETFKDNLEDVISTSRHNKLSVWTSFLQLILGFGIDISFGVKRGRDDVYKFQRLETKFFEPDAVYIESSLQAEGVAAYLSATRYKKPIYMITGIKIARGASVHSKRLEGYEAMLKVGFDASLFTGVPISLGPKGETHGTKEREVKFSDGSDYIFAYRVVKIEVNKDGNLKGHKDFVKGALFSTAEDYEATSRTDLAGWAIEQVGPTSEELQTCNVRSEAFDDEQMVMVAVA